MTNDLEKTFFDTFGIKPKQLNKCSYVNLRNLGFEYGVDVCLHLEDETITCDNCENNKDGELLYPQITDRILLELICLVNIYLDEGFWAETITDLKEEVLKNCLLAVNTTDYGVAGYEESFKHQVQALFEEG